MFLTSRPISSKMEIDGLGYVQYKGTIKQNVDPKNIVRYEKKYIVSCSKNQRRLEIFKRKGSYEFILSASSKKKIAKQLKQKYFK